MAHFRNNFNWKSIQVIEKRTFIFRNRKGVKSFIIYVYV